MQEAWKPIEGYEGAYEVSSLGRVRSIARVVVRGNGRLLPVAARIRKPMRPKDGRLRVTLLRDGEYRHLAVHRLVAQAFIPNPENKAEVNHKNGISSRQYASRTWSGATRAENMQHAFTTGLHNHAVPRPVRCIDDWTSRCIRRLRLPHGQLGLALATCKPSCLPAKPKATPASYHV
jgi:hypothetical protein